MLWASSGTKNISTRNKTAMILNIAHPQVDAWKSGFAALPVDESLPLAEPEPIALGA